MMDEHLHHFFNPNQPDEVLASCREHRKNVMAILEKRGLPLSLMDYYVPGGAVMEVVQGAASWSTLVYVNGHAICVYNMRVGIDFGHQHEAERRFWWNWKKRGEEHPDPGGKYWILEFDIEGGEWGNRIHLAGVLHSAVPEWLQELSEMPMFPEKPGRDPEEVGFGEVGRLFGMFEMTMCSIDIELDPKHLGYGINLGDTP